METPEADEPADPGRDHHFDSESTDEMARLWSRHLVALIEWDLSERAGDESNIPSAVLHPKITGEEFPHHCAV